MHFNRWSKSRAKRIIKRIRRVGECTWIDQNAVDSSVGTLPYPIDEITLVIALSTINDDA
jgi:hypothetical protein